MPRVDVHLGHLIAFAAVPDGQRVEPEGVGNTRSASSSQVCTSTQVMPSDLASSSGRSSRRCVVSSGSLSPTDVRTNLTSTTPPPNARIAATTPR